MNTADLQGMVAAATAAGTTAAPVGIYTTAYQWGQIVGSTTITQWTGTYDYDYSCTG